MKHVSRSAKFNLDNPVLINSWQHGDVRNYEITSAKVTERFDGSEDQVEFFGYRLTKTGKRRKGDYESMIYIPTHNIIMVNDRWEIETNESLKSVFDEMRDLGLSIIYS